MNKELVKKIAGYLVMGAVTVVSEVISDRMENDKLEAKIQEVIDKNKAKEI